MFSSALLVKKNKYLIRSGDGVRCKHMFMFFFMLDCVLVREKASV